MILQAFGWSLVYSADTETVYPARSKFRGFNNEMYSDMYIKLSEFMDENSEDLLKEAREQKERN